MNTHSFQGLFKREMTRKQFLLYAGALLLALTGIKVLMQTISNPSQHSNGFGSGPYGG